MGYLSQPMIRRLFSGLIIVIGFFCCAGIVLAATVYVDLDAGGSNDGSSWANAFADLQSALFAARYGDEIWVAEGTYKPSVQMGGVGVRYSTFQLKNGVSIYGGFSGQEESLSERKWTLRETILSGDIGVEGVEEDNCYHVLYHPKGLYLDSSAILDGFTITSGRGDEDGTAGGMYNQNSSPTVRNCLFYSNSGVKKTGISGGWSGKGGAIYNDDSMPVLINCVFHKNESGYGGGIYNLHSSPIIVNCVFVYNHATAYSGGGSIMGGSGGAVYNEESSPEIVNCVITRNSAGFSGGAIYNSNSSFPNVANSIIWDDTVISHYASEGGKEIVNDVSSVPTFSYCDIEGGVNGDYSGVNKSNDGGGNINADPLFEDSANPAGPDGVFGTSDDGLTITYRSKCVNAGNNSANVEAKDVAGNARIQNGIIDLGAYEKVSELIARYRLYNPNDGQHHYTTDSNEHSVLGSLGWAQEGISCYLYNDVHEIDGEQTAPYYRLYNPNSGEHHWTTDANEYQFLGTIGWRQEGVDGHVFASQVTGSQPLYRLYNPNAGLHHWTMDANERSVIIGYGWKDEGIACYVFP